MSNKKLISIAICVLLIFSVPFPVLASGASVSLPQGSAMSPLYTYINSASSSLSISSGGTAAIKGYVSKTPYGKSIYLEVTLQKYSGGWSDVRTWTQSSTSPSASISKTLDVSKGTYRVKAYFSVSGGSGSESGTVYSKTVTY